MSYPFSALEGKAKTAKRNPQEHLYVIAYTVFGPTGWELGCATITAFNQEDAERNAESSLRRSYNECNGYLRLKFTTMQVNDEALTSLGYHR